MPAIDGAPEESAPLYHVEGGPPLPAGVARFVTTRAGRRVRVAHFEPAGTPRGSVVLSTGRTEPLEKYGEVVGELVARGFVVLAHDWAGQGLSDRFPGDRLRGDLVGGASSLVADLKDILDASAERLQKPWFACAHSMGAALTCLALSEGETRFAGAVLSAPMIEFTVGRLPFWMIRMVVLGMSTLREAELARAQVDPASVHFAENLLTHDRVRYERSVALYRAHPELRVGEPTWRWLRFGVDIRERFTTPGAVERILCPVAIVAAGDDRIVSTEASRRFAARLPHGSYTEVRGSFHEVLMETDARREEFWRAFDGLVARVGAADASPR